MGQRQRLGDRPDPAREGFGGEHHSGEEEHGADEGGEVEVEVVQGLHKAGDKEGEGGKHGTGKKAHNGHQKAPSQGDDAEDTYHHQHRRGEEEALCSSPENFSHQEVVHRNGGGHHAVVGLLIFQPDEGAEGAFECGGKHGIGNENTRCQKLDVRNSLHIGYVGTQSQADTHQKYQRLQEGGQAVTDQVAGVDSHMTVPHAKEPSRQGRVTFSAPETVFSGYSGFSGGPIIGVH